MIIDKNDTQDVIFENNNEYNYRKNLLVKALDILKPREKEIIKLRRLSDKPKKLEELSQKYKISRERVRQIEEKAIEKLQKEISNKN
jgi:RNA polymerase sigma-32 factor